MKPDRNPFAQDNQNDEKDDALDIMRLINQIAQSPSFQDKKNEVDKSPQSMFSGSHAIAQSHHPRLLTDPNASFNGDKRENPIKTYSILRKRVKLQSENEDNDQDDSQFIDSLTNRKITDYFQKKHESLPMRAEVEKREQTETPVIKRMKEKIALKKKNLEDLKAKIQREKQKYERQKQTQQKECQCKKQRLIEFLNIQYKQKIYDWTYRMMDKGQSERESFIRTSEILKKKIDALKEGMKKSKNKGDQAVSYLDQYTEEHQDYMKEWKKKVEDEKKAVTKQIDKPFFNAVFIEKEEQYYELPELFSQKSTNGTKLVGEALPLYCRTNTDNLRQDYAIEIRTLHLGCLQEENMTVLSYPKLMKAQRRMKLKAHLQKLFNLSSRLNEGRGARLFLGMTYFGQPSDSDSLLISRKCWEGVQPITSLKQFLNHYGFLGESIGKYVAKVLLRAHQQGRFKLGQEIVILPKNILFDQKNQIRFDNWLINETYRYEDFTEALINDSSSYLYFPPEYQSQLCIEEVRSPGCWTIGVILYEIIFGRKPFEYSHRLMDYEEFYMMHDLQFPEKPSLSEHGKDFLRRCLTKPGSRLDLMDGLKHPYFESKK